MSIVNCQRVLDQAMTFCAPFSNGIIDGVMINKSDILGYVADAAPENYNIFKSITMTASKKGYKLTDFRKVPFDGSAYSHGEGAIQNKTVKAYTFTVYAQGAGVDRLVDDLKNGRFVLVTRTENGQFEIIGKEAALLCTDHNRQPAGGENDGAWMVTLQCSELTAGNYLFDTDQATTLSTYQALTT